METFDAQNEKAEEDETAEAMPTAAPAATESFPPAAAVSAGGFVSRAVADPSVVRFLRMRPPAAGGDASGSGRGGGSGSSTASSSHLTLRRALRELVDGASAGEAGGGGAKSARPETRRPWLRWEDIEALLFEPYDPTEMFSNPPSTVPIGSASVGPRGAQQQEEEVCVRIWGARSVFFRCETKLPVSASESRHQPC